MPKRKGYRAGRKIQLKRLLNSYTEVVEKKPDLRRGYWSKKFNKYIPFKSRNNPAPEVQPHPLTKTNREDIKRPISHFIDVPNSKPQTENQTTLTRKNLTKHDNNHKRYFTEEYLKNQKAQQQGNPLMFDDIDLRPIDEEFLTKLRKKLNSLN
uniref:Uncharacterized protein n=1 Tax=Bracon brevicornis TaxID=1563983 RepID=A0A6V7KNX5_9HYME